MTDRILPGRLPHIVGRAVLATNKTLILLLLAAITGGALLSLSPCHEFASDDDDARRPYALLCQRRVTSH